MFVFVFLYFMLCILMCGDGLFGLWLCGVFGFCGEQVMVVILVVCNDVVEQMLQKLGFVVLDLVLMQWCGLLFLLGGVLLWIMVQEEFFGDFYVDWVFELLVQGWQVMIELGFVYYSQFVSGWQFGLMEEVFDELLWFSCCVQGLGLECCIGVWLVSFGMEVEGKQFDFVLLIVNLLCCDKCWLDVVVISVIEDDVIVLLCVFGGWWY